MRKFVSMLLVLTLLFPRGTTALASESVEPSAKQAETYFPCSTTLELASNSYNALITKAASRLPTKGTNNAHTRPVKTLFTKLLPSTGIVKLPVIPIDFKGTRMDESLYAELVDYYNAEYDPEKALQAPTEQSVRGAFEKLSYGRLNLQADVLPTYHAEYDIAHYATSEDDVKALAQEALQYYINENILNVADYDYDHDGEIEYASIKFYIPLEQEKYLGSPFGFYVTTAHDTEEVHGFSCTLIYEWRRKTIGESCNTDVHEILHMMGLPDRYGADYHQNYLEANLADIMTAGCEMYLNVCDKIILDWVDPLVITAGKVKDVDLYAVEDYSGNGPKAVVLIPDDTLFPFTEFFVLEYRNATQESSLHKGSAHASSILNYFFYMYGHPGIVIWHCDTTLTYRRSGTAWFKNESMYIKPVYKSGKTIDQNGNPSQLFDASDLYADVYDAYHRSRFAMDTTPSSNFYDGSPSYAAVILKALTPEKATVNARIQAIPPISRPVINISAPSRKVTGRKNRNGVTYTVTYTDSGGNLLPPDGLSFGSDLHFITAKTNSGKSCNIYSEGINPQTIHVFPYSPFLADDPPIQDEFVYLSIQPGYVSNRHWFSKQTTIVAEPFYYDTSPPQITLKGSGSQTIERGETYQELGADIEDFDPDIKGKLKIDASQVDTSKIGTYTVTYSAEDWAGNKTEVERTVVVEDTIAPTATVTYSTTQPTNGDVVATLVPSEKVTVTNNEGSLTHTFTANGSFTFEFEDEAGNKGTALATVANIDKSLPTGTVSYDITGPTNQNVTATLTVEPGITILNNEGKNTHVFTENGSFEFRIRNAVGTEGVVAAAVSWIDKEAPTATVSYSTIAPTNQDVTATIISSEEVTITSEGGTSHTFTENGSFTFAFKDKAGNTGTAIAKVDWIDKEAPVIVLNGDNPQNIQKGDPYMELGAAVTDNADHEIQDKLMIDSSNVDTSTAGEYTVTYNATDEAGNKAKTKIRTVKVKEPPAPPSQPLPSDSPDPDDPHTPPSWENHFTDVKETNWFYTSVEYVCENGLFYGTSDTTFSPNSDMTRGMLATVLYRLAKEPGTTADNLFNDVADGQYYTEAIAWAAENRIVAGYGNNRFGPEDPITREQLATILWRYAGSPKTTEKLDSFTDGNKATDYAVPALQWAVGQRIISGKGSGILDPRGKATRAETAAILMRYCEW